MQDFHCSSLEYFPEYEINHDGKNEVHKMLHKILMTIIQKKKDIENSISNRYGVLKTVQIVKAHKIAVPLLYCTFS